MEGPGTGLRACRASKVYGVRVWCSMFRGFNRRVGLIGFIGLKWLYGASRA